MDGTLIACVLLSVSVICVLVCIALVWLAQDYLNVYVKKGKIKPKKEKKVYFNLINEAKKEIVIYDDPTKKIYFDKDFILLLSNKIAEGVEIFILFNKKIENSLFNDFEVKFKYVDVKPLKVFYKEIERPMFFLIGDRKKGYFVNSKSYFPDKYYEMIDASNAKKRSRKKMFQNTLNSFPFVNFIDKFPYWEYKKGD